MTTKRASYCALASAGIALVISLCVAASLAGLPEPDGSNEGNEHMAIAMETIAVFGYLALAVAGTSLAGLCAAVGSVIRKEPRTVVAVVSGLFHALLLAASVLTLRNMFG